METRVFEAYEAPSGRRVGTVFGSPRGGYTGSWRGHAHRWDIRDFGHDLEAARLFAAGGDTNERDRDGGEGETT